MVALCGAASSVETHGDRARETSRLAHGMDDDDDINCRTRDKEEVSSEKGHDDWRSWARTSCSRVCPRQQPPEESYSQGRGGGRGRRRGKIRSYSQPYLNPYPILPLPGHPTLTPNPTLTPTYPTSTRTPTPTPNSLAQPLPLA